MKKCNLILLLSVAITLSGCVDPFWETSSNKPSLSLEENSSTSSADKNSSTHENSSVINSSTNIETSSAQESSSNKESSSISMSTSFPSVEPSSPSENSSSTGATSSTIVETSSPSEVTSTPSVIPSTPSVEPSSPSVVPSIPSVEPSTPSVMPSTPSVEPSTPSVVPSTPSVEPSTPSVVPSTPSVEPSTPSVMPSSPSVNPSLPETYETLNITSSGYSFESAYFQWSEYEGATSYNVYCDNKLIDEQLIRKYSNCYRADIIGLTATAHNIDIVPVYDSVELLAAKASYSVTPIAHVREGFAFVNGTSSGAYNDDGSLKANAVVIYVNNNNKDTVKAKIKSSSSGSMTECIGVENILTAIKKGYETRPINFRFIGNITDLSSMVSSDHNGDLMVDLNKKTSPGITIEGIGNDATFNGFGLTIKNSSNVEVRNLGFMNCNSKEGDNVSLQQANNHIWVHNCDFFYGHAGSDADQVKGDGALDTKTSSYITHSFNHFFDSGKCNLQGMKEETTENYITYHHNYYDHSDSRHPRVRTCSVHTYNNYFSGISKYGIGATMGASIFVENNYFENTQKPMLSSLQGSDQGTFSGETGGIIKSYGNKYVGNTSTPITYQKNNTSFDCYEASSRNEVIPNTVKTLSGGNIYNNFDTSSNMYSYNVETPEKAKETVLAYAGRVQGGDFKWTFTDSDNKSYSVNQALKDALVDYVGYVPGSIVDSGSDDNNTDSGDDNNNENENTNPSLPETNNLLFSSLTAGEITSNKVINSTFTLCATSDKKMKIEASSVTVDGVTYTSMLKLEGKGNKNYRSIKITVTGAATIKVVAKNNSTTDRPLGLLDSDGETLQSFNSPKDAAGILTYNVDEAGTYYITSLNSGINLYGIIIEYK